MTLIDSLRRLAAGTPPAPAPKIAVSSSGEPWQKWQPQNRDAKTLQTWQAMYERGGPMAEAVDCYPTSIMANGYTLEGGDAEVAAVEERLGSFDFETEVANLVTDAVVLGDGFAEIVRTRGGEFHSLQSRDGTRFTVELDPATGEVLRYRYRTGDEWDERRAVILEPRDVVHIRLWPKPGSPYGRSRIARAIDEINRDADTAHGMAEGVKRHGTPKYDITVGEAGQQVTAAQIDAVADEYRHITAKNEFVHGPSVYPKVLDAGGVPWIEDANNITTQRLATAMGVPEEMLGLGRGSTEATAKERTRVWWAKIRGLQPRVARQLTLQVIDQITGRPGAVRIVYADPDPADEAATATWLAPIMAATPGEPFAVFPRKWVQDRFGVDPDLYPDEEPAKAPPPDPLREQAAPPPPARTVAETEDAIAAAVERAKEKVLAAVAGL